LHPGNYLGIFTRGNRSYLQPSSTPLHEQNAFLDHAIDGPTICTCCMREQGTSFPLAAIEKRSLDGAQSPSL
jgi:hypothetical protein